MAGTEVVAYFVKGTAEASRCLDVSKAAHRIGALFDATMILLDPIGEIVIAAMDDLISQDLADGTGVGIMPIGRDPLWGRTNHVDGLRRSKRLAASIFRFSLTIESTRFPSRSMPERENTMSL
jgi:hypothetical protein